MTKETIVVIGDKEHIHHLARMSFEDFAVCVCVNNEADAELAAQLAERLKSLQQDAAPKPRGLPTRRVMTGSLLIDAVSRASLDKFMQSLKREVIDLAPMPAEPRRHQAQWKQERYPMGKRGR